MKNRITELFGIEYPVIQGGMVWCSGWRLAAAVSEAGGLGLLGAGSMHPETLLEHIRKMKEATRKPWGINLPLMYPEIDTLIDMIIAEGVKIVFTSAGSPKKYTARFHAAGIKVAHVVSSSKFAAKCEEAGVDAVVAEGFEAGGHNGGEAMLAAEELGAEGVQCGTVFAMSRESSAADAFKDRCASLQEGDTMLCLKKLAPTRMIKNPLYDEIKTAEDNGADAEALRGILGKAASKRGIFEGDLDRGELEIGQVASAVKEIQTAAQIVERMMGEYADARKRILG